jgi:hypothetical protein
MRSTVEQLRADIDHGRTGDKIDWPDPAASPLGTDEEAAGTPIPRDVMDATRRAERARMTRVPPQKSGHRSAWVLSGVVAVFALGMSSWMLLR